jgi:hypothetical protein
VIRVLQVLAIGVFLLTALLLWMTAHAVASGVWLAVALVVVATMVLMRRRDRELASSLPEELDRLAWRSDEATVAFIWRFRPGQETRVRITRSERGFAGRRGIGHDQLVVFDAQGDQAVDHDVLPRRTYFYTLLIERPVDAPAAVRIEIATLSAAERAAIEATLEAPDRRLPVACFPETARDRMYQGHVGYGVIGAASFAGEILGGVATDAVFAVADLFAADGPPDGWIEIT